MTTKPPKMTRQRALEATLLQAAETWWKGKRPQGWSLGQHLAQSTVNTCTTHEAALAEAVAAYLHQNRGA